MPLFSFFFFFLKKKNEAPPTPTANRGLTLISKTIQSLASGSEGFSVKVCFMILCVYQRMVINQCIGELPRRDERLYSKESCPT